MVLNLQTLDSLLIPIVPTVFHVGTCSSRQDWDSDSLSSQTVGVHYRDATYVAPVLALHILSGPRLKVCAGGPLTLVSLLRYT